VGMSRGGSDEWLAKARKRTASPIGLLYEFFDCFGGLATTPREMANQLAFLQIDITDPAFHRIALEQGQANERLVAALLAEAVAAGELAPVRTEPLARMLMNLCAGSLTGWAIFREGSAGEWLRADLDEALAPYRTPARRRR
jgi:hypothetical protein